MCPISAGEAERYLTLPAQLSSRGRDIAAIAPLSPPDVTQEAWLALHAHRSWGRGWSISWAHFMGSRAKERMESPVIPFYNKAFSNIRQSGI